MVRLVVVMVACCLAAVSSGERLREDNQFPSVPTSADLGYDSIKERIKMKQPALTRPADGIHTLDWMKTPDNTFVHDNAGYLGSLAGRKIQKRQLPLLGRVQEKLNMVRASGFDGT
eukprot:GDKI01039067.1.p1 GENE.GDKI01039067.1~~GDKI01039067.1.p1  ORF type:complete len:116 (-),score=6.74 GDKI01039067.1:57-404(-)